jgi:hypothetical protein
MTEMRIVMGTKQLDVALAGDLEPGEQVVASRPVATNARVEDASYQTTLALLGPSVFAGAAAGTVTGDGSLPRNTNLVIVTDRRLLWCHKSRLGSEIEVLGADSLAAVHAVEVVPARIVLAKLRVTFHDWSVVQFDLPSDHKATEFVDETTVLLQSVATAA